MLVLFSGAGISAAQETPRAPRGSVNPAEVMPPETVAYFEIVRPGDHLNRLALLFEEAGVTDPLRMLREWSPPAREARPGAQEGVEQDTQPAERQKRGMRFGRIPRALMLLNPALVNELRKIDGLAVAMVGMQRVGDEQQPEWVAVIYPGRSDGIRGMLQFLIGAASEAVEPLDEAALHQLRDGQFAALTHRAVLFGSSRQLLTAAVDRLLAGEPADSLARQERFLRQADDQRAEPGLLLYVDFERLFSVSRETMDADERREFEDANALLGLDALEQLSAHQSLTRDGMNTEAVILLRPGHSSRLYDLLRSPPADLAAMQFVPDDALGFVTGAGNGGAQRYDELVAFLEEAERIDRAKRDAQEDKPTVGERIAQAEQTIGVQFQGVFENVQSLTLVALRPDLDAAFREAQAAQEDEQKREEFKRQLVGSSVYAVARVADPESFEQLLEQVARESARRTTGQQDVEVQIDRQPVAEGELWRYHVPDYPLDLVAGRVGSMYLVAASERLVRRALETHGGLAPGVLDGRITAGLTRQVPESAHKIAMLRLDMLLNLVHEGRARARGTTPRPRVDVMRPVLAYTLEEPEGLLLRIRLQDLTELIATMRRTPGEPMAAAPPHTQPAPYAR